MVKSIFFFKLLFLNVVLNLNSSLANESVDQDFSYIEDEDDRKKCLKLFKSGDLKFDQRSKLYFQLRSKLMGGGDKQFICNNKKAVKTSGSSFAKSMGFGSITLKNDESELDNIEDSKFAEFKPQQRLFCERKLKTGQLKFDESRQQYYELERVPMGDPKKSYICNNEQQRLGPGQALLMANPMGNLLTPLVTDEEDTETGNPFENPLMAQSILKLTKSQSFFLEALGEDQAAQIAKSYVKNLEAGSALGQDDLEKILVQCKLSQELINKKMKENIILDQKAKQTFSKGISYYTAGTAMLATASISTASMASGIGANPIGVLQGISVFFTAKDALTAIPLFFSSTNNLLEFGKEHNIEKTEELQLAKDSLGV
jgi:hypothetical protein